MQIGVNPSIERVVWTKYQDPISHIERWGFVFKGEYRNGRFEVREIRGAVPQE